MVSAAVIESLGAALGPVKPDTIEPLGGGSINRAYRIETVSGQPLFLKMNSADGLDMFEAERDGLSELARCGAVRVPETIACGRSGSDAWLALEYLDLKPRKDHAAERLGRQLAEQHKFIKPEFGWTRSNTIGSTPQINDPDPDWLRFFGTQRIGFQLELAEQNGHTGLRGDTEKLLARLDRFFEGHRPRASLLHGDLWGGNWGALADGEPVLFDPAVYYGDREADIAMTRLFGGFNEAFYEAYNEVLPLDSGHEERCDLYNLYHVLNHLNLFGGGYLQQAATILDSLLSRAG